MAKIVYAAEGRDREFRIAEGPEAVPAGARVYATCTAGGAAEQIGEVTFGSMTDAEFYELRARVREARARASAAPTGRAPRALWRRLFGR